MAKNVKAHLSFAWTGDFESLKQLVGENLKLVGSWSQPGGDKKVFSSSTNVSITCTGRNVRFACLQIYCKSCYKFQICNDLPHLHACKLLICTRGKLGGKCGNGREAVRRKSVANPLQTNYFATSLHACKFNANTKFASDLHIRKSVDYIKLANGLQTCKLVANMKFAIGLHHVLYVRKLVANNKFASDLHIRKCVDYINYTKPLV